MRIESLQFYDAFGIYYSGSIPPAFFDYEFTSLHDVATNVRTYLYLLRMSQAIVYLNNWRYLYVRKDTFDIHYHATFTEEDKKVKPVFLKD